MSNANEQNAAQQPGWDAIDAALEPIYGAVEPFHYGTLLPAMLGGDDPLHGISVYHRTEPLPHFHYVTYGFSDLWGEGELGGDFSKFGFELTFRLACGAEKSEPPAWPLNFLQNIARYVFKTGNHFEAGHHVNCNGPIALERPTEIAFIAFTNDPELPTIQTPYGRVEFLQIVGLCADEYETIKHWRTDKLLAILGRTYPLLVTDLDRHSILLDADTAREVEEAASKEGSLQSAIYAMVASGQVVDDVMLVQLHANVIGDLLLMFDNQLANGHACVVIGQTQRIEFMPGEANAWQQAADGVQITLTPELRGEIRGSLRIERGRYQWPALAKFVLEVVPTEIKDQDGQIVAVIG
ncbi:MAG TPA: suppressor of fused domain protein [Pirellulaceae bacterium]|nr:suppressor of fused domain protein [Pirellulaceae bacterium]